LTGAQVTKRIYTVEGQENNKSLIQVGADYKKKKDIPYQFRGGGSFGTEGTIENYDRKAATMTSR